MNPWPHGCGIDSRETSNWLIIGRDIAWSLPFPTFGRHRRTNHSPIRNGPGWFATGAVLFFNPRGPVWCFDFDRQCACLLDLWHCGVLLPMPGSTARPFAFLQTLPPFLSGSEEKTPQCHKARFHAASRAGVSVVLWCSNGIGSEGYGRHGIGFGSWFRSSFRNFSERSLSKTPGDWQTAWPKHSKRFLRPGGVVEFMPSKSRRGAGRLAARAGRITDRRGSGRGSVRRANLPGDRTRSGGPGCR